MYTSNPTTPTPALATGPRNSTPRPPWWTIPEVDRLQMQAFTCPSAQLRQKVRAATLRSLHHTSLYMRLVLNAKDRGSCIAATGDSLHTRLRENPREGSTLLKFIYGQLYNGKLAKLYGHAPRTNVLSATSPTPAPTLHASAGSTRTYRLASTTRHVSLFTRQSATPQKAGAHSIVRSTSA